MELKLGLIGCGDIGTLRAAAAMKSSHWKLRAVSDVDPERASSVAKGSGAHVDQDWKSLIARQDVDAIVVSTPPDLHAQMCKEALQAGKHVLCEKPLARTSEECKSILDAASRSGSFLATGFNYRFLSSFDQARQWLLAGEIGTLSHVRSYAGYSAKDHNRDWVHDASVTGGGALRDIGIHLIDLTRFFLGEVESVSGYASNRVWRFTGCEDNGFLWMRGKEGVVATLHASWTEWTGYRFQMELYGDRGCIRATCFPLFAELLKIGFDHGRPRRRARYFPYPNIMEHLKTYRWVVIESLTRELDAFAAAIRKAPSIIATGYDGLRAVEMANAPYETSA